ncbi:hypothetical protein J2Z21_007777 [Streptomyces griseochromogenes]|uniref:Uncharacterized protein n=1 Tax=Streptomyces griseochromogenes TaxID=68214 RepID=A0A1B1BAS5_9ACTN|nr:hypothetical protein [Streptomyces griseochromogenes]ANP55936.1 hypothetical protein AVL59_45670 [Streptomyces griseochromogenes]MBP2054767.1 hypothetical protein [Streptomyces griseochromogenes]
MPEETARTDTDTDTDTDSTAPTESGSSPSSVLRTLGCGCSALVGVVLVCVLVLVALLASQSSGSTDFPRVAPEDMASRAFQRSQEAYDVLGFKRTVEPGGGNVGVGAVNTFGSEFCYDGGPLGMEDKTVDGAYRMNHEWGLDHVPASQAVSGLRRLHRHLEDSGWEVTSYREGGKGKDWELYVRRGDGDERMTFIWFPDRQYFTGFAAVPCAYDPAWKDGDVGPSEADERPPALLAS